jgi:hypothetical protein
MMMELKRVDTVEYEGLAVPVWKFADPAKIQGAFVRYIDMPDDLAKVFHQWMTLAACPEIGTAYVYDFTDFMDRDGRGRSGDFSAVVKKYKGQQMNSELAKAVNNITPDTVNDIIKTNRAHASLSVLNNAEIADLPSLESFREMRMAKGMIDQWFVIKLIYRSKELPFVIGYKEGKVFNTSKIIAIDVGAGVLITSNSMYRLDKQGIGEPELDLRLHLCHFLHMCGIGQALGVLAVFY